MIRELDANQLVARARELADAAGVGIRRRGALVAAVVLREASSIAKARAMLADAEIPAEVKRAGLGVLNQVLTEQLDNEGRS